MFNKTYDYDYLNELCDKVSLLEYAERTYDFQKRGSKYFCSCPKHSDSDPSLCISPDVNLFYCFSCGRKGNLINWLMEYEDMEFHDAVEKVAELANVDVDNLIIPESLRFYKQLSKQLNNNKTEKVTRQILDFNKDYEKRFKNEIPQEWIDEGISEASMKKYEIRVDEASNRIVYPVYDSNFNFIGIKGRTRFKNYKELKIMKYINYNKISILDYFTGMKQAFDAINRRNEIIIVEGIKSVMKLDGWGFHNVVSAETSTLNEYQIELLIKKHIKNIVIAFDKDVKLNKITDFCKMLKRFANVEVVIDKWNLLDEKDSPPDKGIDVWKTLYERRVRI